MNAYDKNGAFFAFSKEQFDESKKDGVKYYSLDHGLICPVDTYEQFKKDFENERLEFIKKELEENTKKELIWKAFSNYECSYTQDYSDVVFSKEYGITQEMVDAEWRPFFKYCIDNDLI